MRTRHSVVIIPVVALAAFCRVSAGDDTPVPYPDGYRHWTHLHSRFTGPTSAGSWKRPCEKPCTAGIFHYYANDKAMTGLRTGEYTDGAIIAEELLEVLGSPSGAGKEGERRMVRVMVKDAKRYESTGGWGFGTFDGVTSENQLDSAGRKACFECHIPRKDHGYVFTEYAGDDASVPYPDGYRHWTHLHSSFISPTLDGFWKRPCEKPCTAGIFHFYANEKAMIGLRGGEYGDGAIIAEELLEVLGSLSVGGKEGERRMVGVMVKDSKRYAATGGWGFGKFDGATLENQLDSAGRKACFACHIPRKAQGFVFTEYRDR